MSRTLPSLARGLAFAFAGALAVAGSLAGQDDGEGRDLLREPTGEVEEFLALHDRGGVPLAAMIQALDRADTAVQVAAVAVLRHTWAEWPRELLGALERRPVALAAVLRELALAPRPSVAAWVAHLAGDDARELPLRLLALAARGTPLDRREGELVVRGLGAGEREAAVLAASLLPGEVADTLVAKVHALLLSGDVRAAQFEPFFARLTPRGMDQLLGLVATLPEEARATIAGMLAARDNPHYLERVRAALDGEIPLEEHLLMRAGPLLDTAARRERVAAILADAAAAPSMRVHAFDALLEAGVWVPAMGVYATEPRDDGGMHDDRMRRLLQRPPQGMDDAILIEALARDDSIATTAARVLQRGMRSLAVERAALERLRSLDPGSRLTTALRRALVEALVRSGTDAGVRGALDVVRDEPELLTTCYESLGSRRDPIATAALLTELERQRDPALADALRLALAECGDLRQLERLVAGAPDRDGAFVRRCRHAVPVLREPLALAALDGFDRTRKTSVRVELLLWAGRTEGDAVRDRVARVWDEATDEEVREAALRVLMTGPRREPLLARWRAGGFAEPEIADLVVGEAVATAAEPADEAAVQLLQTVLFEASRRDVAREREIAARFPDGRTGFPLVNTVALRLRREPAILDDVLAPARTLAANDDVAHLSRQRFLFFLTALQAMPELRERAGRRLARLLTTIPDEHEVGEGVAWYYRVAAHAADGEHAEASAAARRAVRLLLCDPAQRMFSRIHLGVRDPESGVDPHAALAAASALHEALAARAADDREAAAAALLRARELAGRDRAILERIEQLSEWSRR